MLMPVIRPLVISMTILAVATVASNAQPYPSGQPYPPGPAPVTPQSWSYDPYTSGMAPCPQGIPGDLETCAQKMPPTYGQPNYWSSRR